MKVNSNLIRKTIALVLQLRVDVFRFVDGNESRKPATSLPHRQYFGRVSGVWDTRNGAISMKVKSGRPTRIALTKLLKQGLTPVLFVQTFFVHFRMSSLSRNGPLPCSVLLRRR